MIINIIYASYKCNEIMLISTKKKKSYDFDNHPEVWLQGDLFVRIMCSASSNWKLAIRLTLFTHFDSFWAPNINDVNTASTSPHPALCQLKAQSTRRVQQLDPGCCGRDRSLYRCGHYSPWFPIAWPAWLPFVHFISLRPDRQEQL